MKKVISFKLYLKHDQNGFVLIFAIFLLLIIVIFTLAFFYLQFLEVDLIANETENLQAFYLANAGLEQGIRLLEQDQRNITNQLRDNYIYRDQNRRTDIELSPNKQGTIYSVYRYIVVNNENIIIITGIGLVNGNYNTRREVEMRFTWQTGGLLAPDDWLGEHFGPIVAALNYPVVMSRLEPNLQEVITFIRKDEHEFKEYSKDQSIIKIFNELTPAQMNAYENFAYVTKTDISQARLIDRNDNGLIFPEERRALYNSPYLDEIRTPEQLQMLYGSDCPFEYTEYRKKQGGRTIISSFITIKRNKLVTLKKGLYFFDSLTLEKNSILNTDGGVQIYVKKLELKENARLIGGTNTDHNNASPNDLVILAQRWDGAFHDSEDGVKIGSTAKVCGHIFAPNLKVKLSRGSKGKETRVHGSILTNQLVTYIEPGRQGEYGPIQIIYEEYLDEEINQIPGSWREVRNP